MKIAVGFDHAGFPLKQIVLDTIRARRDMKRLIWAQTAPSLWTSRITVKKLDEPFKAAKPIAESWSAVQGSARVLPRTK